MIQIQNGLKGKRSILDCMSLKDFIILYQDDLEKYYGEDFGSEEIIDTETHGQIVIFCLVDQGNDRYTSPIAKKGIKKGGKERRDKVKHRYSYKNPLNRIHGYIIAEEANSQLTPKEKNIISLSLICSSSFSDKRGIGSDLMEILKDLSLNAGFTDIILEVANEFSAKGKFQAEEEEEDEEEEDEEEELSLIHI